MSKNVIVIGSGAAGMTAASEAKRCDPSAKVTVITEDEHIAYSPCVIPWALEGKAKWEDIVMHDATFYRKERDIEVLTKTKVASVSDADKKVVTEDGNEFAYDSLVIATGSTVFIPPVEGKDLKGVFGIKTINDGKAIESALRDAKKVVIAGAGVIGLEAALAFVNIGKEVTVIEMMDQVIPRIADRDMAEPDQKYLEGKGVKFMMKTPVQGVIGTDKVEAVNAGGQTVPCDMVVFATGVRANVDLADQMGLDKGQMGALLVSPTLQAYKRGRLVPDVFVAGDVMQCQSAVYPGPTMSQLGSSANKEGRIAGANAAGKKLEFGPVASPWVSIIGDLQIAGTGMSLGLASWYGADCVTGKATGRTRARYYPDAKEQTVKVIADKTTHRLVGAQILAGEEATGRIDWLTAAIVNGTPAEEFLANSENAYCPPTSQVRDVVFAAVEDLVKNL